MHVQRKWQQHSALLYMKRIVQVWEYHIYAEQRLTSKNYYDKAHDWRVCSETTEHKRAWGPVRKKG